MYSQFESLDFEVNELEVEVQHKQTIQRHERTKMRKNSSKFVYISPIQQKSHFNLTNFSDRKILKFADIGDFHYNFRFFLKHRIKYFKIPDVKKWTNFGGAEGQLAWYLSDSKSVDTRTITNKANCRSIFRSCDVRCAEILTDKLGVFMVKPNQGLGTSKSDAWNKPWKSGIFSKEL